MKGMNSQEQLNLTRDIIMKQFHPEQYEAEQIEKQKKIADMLAFVDGVVAAGVDLVELVSWQIKEG